MNQFVAISRRVSAAAALLVAVTLLSGLTPARVRAQSDAKPSEAAPIAPSVKTADAGKQAKPAKASKGSKASKAEKAEVAARSKVGKAPKPPKTPKTPKPPKVESPKEPEKPWEEQKKEDGIYAKRSNWLSFRFGYAKRSGTLAGDGMVGYGLGYQRMLSRQYAFSAGVGHDILGHFGGAIDEAVLFTGEFQRHYNWKTTVRPYVGLGGGFYLRKAYRTAGEYTTTTTGGPHVSVGFTSALDANHVIGLEARAARVGGREGIVNPTFGPDRKHETLWTAKISWGLVY